MKSNKIKIYNTKMVNVGTPDEEQVQGDLIKEVLLDLAITSNQAMDLEMNKSFCSNHGLKVNSIFVILSK